VLFDVYAIWQHLQLQSVRRQLQEQQALRHAEEKYRAIFEDAVVEFFRPLRKVVGSVSTRALAQMHGYDSPEQLLAEVSNMTHQLFVDPGRMDELTRALNENGVVRSAEVKSIAETARKSGSW